VAGRGDAGITPAHRATIAIAVVATAAALVLLVLLLTGRDGGPSSAAHNNRAAAAPPPSVRLVSTKLGRILTDAQGRALYLFDEDERSRSHCFRGCAKVWPPAIVTGRPRAGPGLAADKLTTTRRGHPGQLVYAGHPLYRLDADTRAGETQGEGFGGTWWLVSARGRRVVAPGMHPSKGGY
jgi:predicted lipoprotein with Yx(FWY)xxD motif